MSIKVMNNVWQESKAKGSQRLVLLAIADNANDAGSAFPGISKALAKKTLLTPRAVGYNIDLLAQSCELGVYPRPGKSHHYIVFSGMKYREAAEAIRKLAKERGEPVRELSHLRKTFASEAKGRIEARRDRDAKKLRNTSEGALQGDPKGHSHEPSLTIPEPSEPKGSDASASDQPKVNRYHPMWSPVWEAIVEVTGVDTSMKPNASNVAGATKQIIASPSNYTVEDVLFAPKWWKAQNYPGRVTVNGLVKWLQDIRAARLKNSKSTSAPRPYVPEPVKPIDPAKLGQFSNPVKAAANE